jgi:hypothetical protein
VSHIECRLVGETKFFGRFVKGFPIKSASNEVSLNRPAIMGIFHQSIGGVCKCMLAVLAKETLPAIFMAVF